MSAATASHAPNAANVMKNGFKTAALKFLITTGTAVTTVAAISILHSEMLPTLKKTEVPKNTAYAMQVHSIINDMLLLFSHNPVFIGFVLSKNVQNGRF